MNGEKYCNERDPPSSGLLSNGIVQFHSDHNKTGEGFGIKILCRGNFYLFKFIDQSNLSKTAQLVSKPTATIVMILTNATIRPIIATIIPLVETLLVVGSASATKDGMAMVSLVRKMMNALTTATAMIRRIV